MKLGVSTWSLLGVEVSDAVRMIGDAGFDYVELWGEIPHAYPDWTNKRKLKDALSSYNFTVTMHAPFTDLNVATPYEPVKSAIEKALVQFVNFSDELGATIITFHPGSVHNDAMVPQSIGNSVSMLKSLVKAADGRLTICIENQARGALEVSPPSWQHHGVAGAPVIAGRRVEAEPRHRACSRQRPRPDLPLREIQ